MKSPAPQLPTILAFGPGSWPIDWVYGSPRYHLFGLARSGYRVLYVEPPQGRLRNRAVLRGHRQYRPGVLDFWPDRPLSLYHPATRLFFHPRLPIPETALRGWNRAVLSRLAREVRSKCPLWNMPEYITPDLLWLGSYHHAPLIDQVIHRKSVAFIYDDLPASPAWGIRRARLVAQMERELLERVDLAIFTSKVLLESRKNRCRRALLLENAVSEDFFDESLPPPPRRSPGHPPGTLEKVASLGSPRIGYVGAVNLRLDPEYCRALGRAAASRGWHVVFAGGIDRLYSRGIEQLRAMPNVHFPGHVPPDQVPRLLRLFDVLILPHAVTPFTRAMFPEKVPEYLATGRPIVSTRLPEVERVVREGAEVRGEVGEVDGTEKEGAGAEPLIFFADSPRRFVDACAGCLKTKTDPATARARIALARRHTRAQRLEILLAALRELFEE